MNQGVAHPSQQMLQEILGKYLGKEDFAEVNKQFSSIPGTIPVAESDFSASSNIQIQFEVDHKFKLGSQINLLITLMEMKLPSADFYNFLLELGQICITSGEFTLAEDVHETILRQVQNDSRYQLAAANANLALGTIYRRESRFEMSALFARKSISLFQSANDNEGIAKCERLLGNIDGDCGNLDGAKSHYKKSLSLLTADSDKNLIASLETNIGIICNIEGQFEDAYNHFNSALEQFYALDDKRRIADVLHNIGMMHIQQNNYNIAVEVFNKSIALSVEINNLPLMGMSYLGKSFLYAKMHDHLLATAYADKALEICIKVKDKTSVADIYKVKGIINKNLGHESLSESYFLTSIRLNKELNNLLNEAEASFELALLYMQSNRYKDAYKHLHAARAYYEGINSAREVAKIDLLLGMDISMIPDFLKNN